jgi:hypothetical protein
MSNTVQTGALDRLLSRLRGKLTISDFKSEIDQYWGKEIVNRQHLAEIRFSSGPGKRLMDEIMPVSRMLKFGNITEGWVQFPQNYEVPDCYLWERDTALPTKIEITVSQGRERFHRMKELFEEGHSHGYVGLQDDASEEDFKTARGREHSAYSTEKVLECTKREIEIALNKKNDPKYTSMQLIISTPLRVEFLPFERWAAIKEDLVGSARALPLARIDVIGDQDPIIGFRIK